MGRFELRRLGEHDTSWKEHGACATPDGRYNHLFFCEKGERYDEARKLCAVCPVQQTCLDWAVATNQTEGVWGGLIERERRTYRRRLQKQRLKEQRDQEVASA